MATRLQRQYAMNPSVLMSERNLAIYRQRQEGMTRQSVALEQGLTVQRIHSIESEVARHLSRIERNQLQGFPKRPADVPDIAWNMFVGHVREQRPIEELATAHGLKSGKATQLIGRVDGAIHRELRVSTAMRASDV